jgi:hypothetical protein
VHARLRSINGSDQINDKCQTLPLVLCGSDPSYNNSVTAFWWNVERLDRLLDGLFLGVRVDRPT